MGFTAAFYDFTLWLGERRGMSERRARTLAAAHGRTLEIGAGTGLNLRHYTDRVEELVLTEPVDAMATRLHRRAAERPNTRVVAAEAERLPFPDDSFDTVVSTLVFCTVGDPRAAAAEVARVLRPGGQLLFIEHVRSDHDGLARWQDRLHGPWRAFGDGCNCNLPVVDLIAGSLPIESVEPAKWSGMPAIVSPLAIGRARAAA